VEETVEEWDLNFIFAKLLNYNASISILFKKFWLYTVLGRMRHRVVPRELNTTAY
jgi:hypothetical protein